MKFDQQKFYTTNFPVIILFNAKVEILYLDSLYVTRSDKKGSIARNYRCLINSLYFHFYVSYNNSVNISKISMNFYISDANF